MDDLQREVFEEGKKFIRQNKGLKLDTDNPSSSSYVSPRISSEFMDCSMPLTFDQFSHCSLGCLYCFAYFFKSTHQTFSEKLHSINPQNLIETLEGKPKGSRAKLIYEHFVKKKFLIHWGGMADPFCNFEKSNNIGIQVVKTMGELDYPCLFSFKGSAIFRPNFQRVFSQYAQQKNFAFQVSIISPSDATSAMLEIGVPITSRRIEAIRMLSQMGYYTILRLRPFIIGITDQGLDELLHRCLDAGIRAVSMEFFAMDNRSSEGMRKRYKWLGKLIGVDDLHKYYRTLSPPERGGYMRLNRAVKERFVKQVYTFCINNDLVYACSDPDFKELNTSGSCCGMPDKYPENRVLENWTHNQLTYALKEARRQYHLKGRQSKLYFDRVFKTSEDTYLKDQYLAQDHAAVSEFNASVRHYTTGIDIMKKAWNNLRSPGNPRNYFHGKVMPIGVDGGGQLVYKYIPSSYEAEWLKEGIDLTK
jgi:DNA repair photolyase